MKCKHLLKYCGLLLLTSALLLVSCGKTAPGDASSETSSESGSSERKYTLVSVGKPYKTSSEASSSYPDMFGQQLTDGQKLPDNGSFYMDVRMVGYVSTCRFDIDLGEDGKRICAIVARSLDIDRHGVKRAGAARFFGSNDGETWTGLGRDFFKPTGDMTVSTVRLELDEVVDYRYIRVTMSLQTGAGFYFLDELEVYADVPEKEQTLPGSGAYTDEQIDRNAWKALSTGKPASPAATDNVARGATYEFLNATPDPRAQQSHDVAKLLPTNTVNPPFNEILTDGARTGRPFGDRVWTGVQAKECSLSVDLGQVRDNLFSFRLHMLSGGTDVEYPAYVDVFGSDDNQAYTLLGRMYAPASGANYAYTLILPEYIHARYLRFDFPNGNSNYWMEEVEAFAGLDDAPAEELYAPVTFPKVTEDLYWDSSEADYATRQNLLLGKKQQVATSYYMNPVEHADETPGDTDLLTDGKLASTLYCYNGEFFFHRGGGAIQFFFDLEKISSVESLNISYLEQLDWGINHPNYITVLLSNDANHWYPVKTDHITNEASPTEKRIAYELSLDHTYAARFISIRVESAVLFIDEIELTGTKKVASDAVKLEDSGVKPVPYYTNEDDRAYSNVTNTDIKAKDIPLVYGDQGDESSLLPLVAYLDADGKIVDTFMDGFLYCPTGALPSGNALHLESKMTDWEWMRDTVFDGVTGIGTLDQVVGKVKTELNKPDYKVQVYITILVPHETVTDFGDIDGDGTSESLATPEGRRKVLDWYIGSCKALLAERNYQNIELGGFYYLNESVNYYNDDAAIIREIADAVHSADSYLLWIPYYNAHRYYLGYELGFDLVCMQPNYAFTLDKPLSNFTSTARRMKTHGMCVEIENSYQSLADPLFARNYMLYLYYGATTGYMKDAIHIYYDDINNFSSMAYSDGELLRMQYDATYQFVKGTLNITPETRSALTFEGSKDTILQGTVAEGETLAMFTLVSAPQHGYLSFGADGSFVYYPEKGYTGEDSFTYTYNRYLGESEPCTVNLTVK